LGQHPGKGAAGRKDRHVKLDSGFRYSFQRAITEPHLIPVATFDPRFARL
jgi:hypothetical protein